MWGRSPSITPQEPGPGPGPIYPRFTVSVRKGRGNAPRSIPAAPVVSLTTSPLSPRPSPLNKMGVARSTGGNLLPPPHNLPPGKATGREAKRGPAFELPPGVSGAPRCTAWWGVAPGRSRYGEGHLASAATGKARKDLGSHPFGLSEAFWRAPRFWEGAARGHARSMRAPRED